MPGRRPTVSEVVNKDNAVSNEVVKDSEVV